MATYIHNKICIHVSILHYEYASPVGSIDRVDTNLNNMLPPPTLPKAPEARYPYAASIQYDSQHFCGGALVAPDIVVTAAHCDSTATITGIVLGMYDLDSATDTDYEVMEVVYAMTHPGWDPIAVSNDVALLFLGGESRHPYVRINGDGDAPTEGEYLAVLGECAWRWSYMYIHRGSFFRFFPIGMMMFLLYLCLTPPPPPRTNPVFRFTRHPRLGRHRSGHLPAADERRAPRGGRDGAIERRVRHESGVRDDAGGVSVHDLRGYHRRQHALRVRGGDVVDRVGRVPGRFG